MNMVDLRSPSSGGGGGVAAPRQPHLTFLTFGGRWNLEPNRKWAAPNASYGAHSEIISQGCGSGDNPAISTRAIGHILEPGETLISARLCGQSSSTDLAGIEFQLYFRELVSGSLTLLGVSSGQFTGTTPDEAIISANFTAPASGFLIPAIRSIAALPSKRYLYAQGRFQIEVPHGS